MPTQVQMAPEDGKAMMLLTVSQKQTLEEAAQESVEQFKLEVVNSQKTRINGLSALNVVSTQTNPQDPSQVIKLLSHYIQYDGLIYVFHGVTSVEDYNSYSQYFSSTARGFKKLSDRSKINVTPERIKIVNVPSNMTLTQAFSRFNISQDRHEELSVVNGMQVSDPLNAGDKIKIVVK